MPSREEYFDDESPFNDGGRYPDTEEEVTTTRQEDRAEEESEMPNYSDTDIGNELRRLYGLYGFDTSRRFERNDYEVMQTSDMVNEVYPPSQMGGNIYISNFKTAEAYLQGEEMPRTFPRIKYVMSVIDFREDNRSWTWYGLVPRDTKDYPAGNLFRLNVRDNQNVNLMEWFPKICAWIHDKVETREDAYDGILIHCRQGISRSATAIMAYLMWRDRMDHKQALEHVRKSQLVAYPNKGFMAQLRVWGECKCDFSDEEGMNRYREYVFGEERELDAADPDHLPRPNVMTDLAGFIRPANPHRPHEPQPQPEPARRWYSLR
ncbi:hypothetical protein LTR70_006942 [Exophiala xenobiotica]|uniref:protein-tyrosine-phosphatase n=1 Tax=Lithohypha guttulata TaxID=1690604 RepID=A0ABR0K5Y5_9EURO|nr:hypothetical protein LTR24_006604 [Lithohypha guttulata]KAK5314901.1 hypothetical protein LTR70_006942 [Exophiala xenobiotica]